jgi:UDP-N-acetyl-D-mannosaminuronic acid dehydrogenase
MDWKKLLVTKMKANNVKIAIIGGCGRVGLPFGLKLSSIGDDVCLVDKNIQLVEQLKNGLYPYQESGIGPESILALLKNIKISVSPEDIIVSDIVFITVAPPPYLFGEEFFLYLKDILIQYHSFFSEGQLIIFRTTLYPGTFEKISNYLLKELGLNVSVGYAPERIAQSLTFNEFEKIPQIISSFQLETIARMECFFQKHGMSTIQLEPLEAELTKIITNSWRFSQFALANQFYMLTEEKGISFNKILNAMTNNYPRTNSFARAGFAGGPCLIKDTMQLIHYSRDNFILGELILTINKALPLFVVNQIQGLIGDLKGKKIAVFGISFKANCDDVRESLFHALRQMFLDREVTLICLDPYFDHSSNLLEAEGADAWILCTPHDEYINLKPPCPFVDCWGYWGI